jgi:hypothetical protein
MQSLIEVPGSTSAETQYAGLKLPLAFQPENAESSVVHEAGALVISFAVALLTLFPPPAALAAVI